MNKKFFAMIMLHLYINRRKKVISNYGIPFECVELVRRFYNQYYGLTFPSVRDAYEMFEKIDSLIYTGNHQVVLLQTIGAPNIDRICVGDALFLQRNKKNNNYGHVAIIVYSDGKKVVIAQQNQENALEVYNTRKLIKEMNMVNSQFIGLKRLPDWIPKPTMIYVKVI
jgi:hypothetical protein